MPVSTSWRCRPDDHATRGVSPVRPSDDLIERLSPAPLESPTFTSHSRRRDSQHNDRQNLQGLGLFGTSLSKSSYEFGQPDHLYIDQNGGAHVNTRVRLANSSTQNHRRDARRNEARATSQNAKPGRGKSHTRSGSTIDDLANAAIATSPRFAGASLDLAFSPSPSTLNRVRPATSYMHGHQDEDTLNDRPTKRIRSDKLNSAEWSSRNERPRTSHADDYQSPRPEEAELLLGLRYNWNSHASPPMTLATVQIDHMKENIKPPNEAVDDENTIVKTAIVDKADFGDVIETTAKDEPQVVKDPDTQVPRIPQTDVVDKEQDVKVEGMQPAIPTVHVPHDEPPVLTAVPAEPVKPALAESSDMIDSNIDVDRSKSHQSNSASKKPRKIKPEVQAEVCASCLKLQREGDDEDTTTQWIGCEHCNKWFHAACVGLKDKLEARAVDKFFCKNCEVDHGKTTFVRKSSRARTAIDYAGLNQGVVKPSGESTMHHYIQPIKDGRIKYQSDDFARIRPELMTADFWENMDGMKRPFVVPACWNPRFGIPANLEEAKLDSIHQTPLSTSAYKYFNNAGEEVPDAPFTEAPTTTDDALEVAHVEVVDCDQDFLDMVMPRHLTVRKVAELFGPEQPVPVIDVKSQETKGQFTLADWADYYELDGEKPIRNVISLEVSNSRLGRLIRRPRVVRDIDLEDRVWDHDSRSTSNKRPVQFYCLMSVADSYTDFHIDFGGSSVYYHILKGIKTFFFIPPEDRYLKKYEEWCNSDTQNETWLGDLCGGNVTRVDLHEGDTAFIPAGWIHSVWTPEDSLVIGGNFLTHLDYELQLKVANVEKTTRVPQKFRYPFFQKVMWYTLLKYLDDDPVPEEVLRDFHEDDDYRFPRANPIWSGVEDIDPDTEPSDPAYNARLYPKAELKGLPALRDYLYRTARIHADLPVSDINKKQIDAVKASIPKGHGDPMQLIKTFAVWCAWKIGNETVPDWVHTDLNGLLPEIKEREKHRRSETFRVPPERVSARKAQQPQESPSDEVPVSPKAAQTPESEETARKRNGSRSSGLRVACEACRKRRIKCRHKEGDVSPAGSSPPAIRPRTYSNVSVDIPKLASASPILTGFEQAPTVNSGAPEYSSTDLAQAALASLHSQSSDPTPLVLSTPSTVSAKKGRSKACEECRKSKRRCVHDEYGRVDPAKAAEPSKPRGSASTKRAARTSDEGFNKKVKIEAESDPTLMAMSHATITDAMIDPALMAVGVNGTSYDPASASLFAGSEMDLDHVDPSLQHRDPVTPQIDDIVHKKLYSDLTEMPELQPSDDVGMAGTGESGNMPVPLAAQIASLRQSPVHDISFSPITVDGNLSESIEKCETTFTELNGASVELGQSQHLPQQADDYNGSGLTAVNIAPVESLKGNERRASSEASAHTLETTAKSRRSSSNTSGNTHQAGSMVIKQQASARPVSRGSTAESDVDADEKLARELQAAENGLRRRASVRA